MAAEGVQLRVEIGLEADADAMELDDETLGLRRELLDLDVDGVERPAADPPPPGTRAVEAAVLGTLLVEVGRQALGPALSAITEWMARRRSRSVKLTLDNDSIELSAVSDEDQRRLLEAFLARHAAPT